jgi:hypothetical protein
MAYISVSSDSASIYSSTNDIPFDLAVAAEALLAFFMYEYSTLKGVFSKHQSLLFSAASLAYPFL